MKNLHLLPTDKPSRLYLHSNGKIQIRAELTNNYLGNNQHIYITTSEEIKEGDYFYSPFQGEERILKHNKFVIPFPKDRKIILTTDQDLIKDGVQAIQDDFIEWFVLEESAKQYAIKEDAGEGNDRKISEINSDFLAGAKSDAAKDYWYAKWQSERMYSEEEVIIILNKFGSNVYGNYTRNEMMCDFVERWFEQFKK